MKYFSGSKKKKTYFEGWYFKHQKEDIILSLIPGIQMDDSGNVSAFIQVIMNENSYYVRYPVENFDAKKDKLHIQIEDNLFTSKGIKVNINTSDIKITGSIRYGSFTPIKYSIMGPLKCIPMMPCRHEILSMEHTLSGSLTVNGQIIDFTGGKGYLESDLGTSFPNSYFWTHSNSFTKKNCSITACVADITVLGKELRGCFAILKLQGKEIRLATYLGAKVPIFQNNVICLRQGKYTLYIMPKIKTPHILIAPDRGNMNRTIFEDTSANVRFLLYVSGKKKIDMTSRYANVEMELENA